MLGMILETLTEEEENAVETALRPYRTLLKRFGDDRNHLGNFDAAMLGYRGFGERLAGDALRKIDYLLYPRIKELQPGNELVLDGITLSIVKHDKELSVTVVDADGVQRFRINWKNSRVDLDGWGHGGSTVEVKIQSCPEHDPQYPYADGIGFGTVMRDLDDPIEGACMGTIWGHDFFAFVEAMDVLRPSLSADILAMPRQKRFAENVSWSREELDKKEIADVVRLDGGLAGHLARHVFSTILRERGVAILTSLAHRTAVIAGWLEREGCIWGGAAMTTHSGDNAMYAVRSAVTGNLALLYNANNTCGPHIAFLAWKDVATGTATIAAAKRGRRLLETVASYLRGDMPDAPTATIDLSTGEHDLGRAMLETSILDLALCHVGFVEDDLAVVASDQIDRDEFFVLNEDFGFFIESNGIDDEDDLALEEVVFPGP
jgi:hypothetical protein